MFAPVAYRVVSVTTFRRLKNKTVTNSVPKISYTRCHSDGLPNFTSSRWDLLAVYLLCMRHRQTTERYSELQYGKLCLKA